jgi:hypothetical protein
MELRKLLKKKVLLRHAKIGKIKMQDGI